MVLHSWTTREAQLPTVLGSGRVLVPEGDVEALAAELGGFIGKAARREDLGRLGSPQAQHRYTPAALAPVAV